MTAGEPENWLDAQRTIGPMVCTIQVDTSQVDALNKQLEEIRDLFAVPKSMATFRQRIRWLITGRV